MEFVGTCNFKQVVHFSIVDKHAISDSFLYDSVLCVQQFTFILHIFIMRFVYKLLNQGLCKRSQYDNWPWISTCQSQKTISKLTELYTKALTLSQSSFSGSCEQRIYSFTAPRHYFFLREYRDVTQQRREGQDAYGRMRITCTGRFEIFALRLLMIEYCGTTNSLAAYRDVTCEDCTRTYVKIQTYQARLYSVHT